MITFSFGRNWKRYVKYVLNEDILQNAQDSLVRFLGENFDFNNKVFVDIGCGSGIFSIAALNLGFSKVLSVDIDKQSIEATLLARDKFAPQAIENWEIFQGSILEDSLLQTLRKKIGDKKIIVYSWGVLHHTGDLQKAMQNVMDLVSGGGGQLCLYCPLQQNTSEHLVA